MSQTVEIKRKQNFWQLLEKTAVEVPALQRDYVQAGAKAKLKNIPDSFIKNLYEALQTKNHLLSLEFIYGYTDKQTHKLYLLDGQQRFTTLFLLHYYLALWVCPLARKGAREKTKQAVEQQQKNLFRPFGNFSYATRSHTRDFCRLLVEKGPKLAKEVQQNHSIKELLLQAAWFNFSAEDPTISSMVAMLEIIEQHFKDAPHKEMWNKLKNGENCPVFFNFLNLGSFAHPEENYLKMNARGKQLTEYEIFKSQLTSWLPREQTISGCEGAIEQTAEYKLDNTWQQVFWKLAQKPQNAEDSDNKENNPKLSDKNPIFSMDEKQYYFFERITLWLKLHKQLANLPSTSGESKITNPFTQEISAKTALLKQAPEVYKSQENYGGYLVSVAEGLVGENGICIWKKTSDPLEEKLYQAFLNILNEKTPSIYARLQFYALMLFFMDGTLRANQVLLKQWFRVCYNLIQNTLTDDEKNLPAAAKALKNMWDGFKAYWDHAHQTSRTQADFYDFFLSYEVGFFNMTQVEEEKNKIKIIKNRLGLSEADIRQAEANQYFDGKINFLLEFCQLGNTYDKKQFDSYFKKLNALFVPVEEKKSETELHCSFRRALLTFSAGSVYYLPTVNNRERFCLFTLNLRSKQDTWHRVFNDSVKRNLLKQLLDKLSADERKWPAELEQIGQQFLSGTKDMYQDWRYLFIGKDSPLPLTEIRRIDANVFFKDGNRDNWRRKGEIYTYCFYKWCEKNQKKLWADSYECSTGIPRAWVKKEFNNVPYLFSLSYNGKEFKLTCEAATKLPSGTVRPIVHALRDFSSEKKLILTLPQLPFDQLATTIQAHIHAVEKQVNP